MPRFNSLIVKSAVIALPALLAMGCSHTMKHDDSMSNMDMKQPMSKTDMMNKGDDMITKGQKMKDDAMKMDSGSMMNGMTKDEMMMQGDKMMKDGQMMKDNAMKM